MPTPGPGQTVIEGMAEFNQPPLDLDSRAAFGRLLTPRFFDLSPELVPAEPSTEALKAISVPVLRQRFYETGRQSVDGILWNADEFEAIVRHPNAFGEAVVAKTTKARQIDPNLERRQGAANRSELHAFEAKQEKMRGMLEYYTEEQEWLRKLVKEAQTPGYAHMRARDLLALATNTWQLSFKNILRTVGEHREWTPDQTRQAETAMTFQLFYAPQKPKNPVLTPKLDYWRGLLDLSYEANRRHATLVRQRVRSIDRFKEKHAKQLSTNV